MRIRSGDMRECRMWIRLALASLSFFFFSSRRRHTRCLSDWSSDCALPICPLDADAVGPHDRPDRLAVRAGYRDPDGVAELVAELEDVADLDAPLRLDRVTADDARLARDDLAQVRPRPDGDVPLDVDAAQVSVVGVGAGEHAPPAAQRLVGDHRVLANTGRQRADRARAAGERAGRECISRWPPS